MKYKQDGNAYNAEDLYALARVHTNFAICKSYLGGLIPSGLQPDAVAIQIAVQNSMDAGLTADDFIKFEETYKKEGDQD